MLPRQAGLGAGARRCRRGFLAPEIHPKAMARKAEGGCSAVLRRGAHVHVS